VAFELGLRNLELTTSHSGWPLSTADNHPAELVAPHGLGNSIRAAQSCCPLRLEPSPAGHGPDHPYPGGPQTSRPLNLPWTGRTKTTRRLTQTATGLPPFPGPHTIHPWTTVSQQPWPGRPDWTTVTLVSDSFPRKRKPPPRVTLLVGMTHQRAECRVNLRAGVRVSPSGTPPGPYSAYTCPSPGATDWS
jgi:hypothetical protein